MTSPVAGLRPSRPGDDPGRVSGLPSPARRRRPVLVIIGLMVAILAAALVAALLNAATATTLVWATAGEVSRGHPVQPDDLVAVEVNQATDGIRGWSVQDPAGRCCVVAALHSVTRNQ